jgi:hypothetical protein
MVKGKTRKLLLALVAMLAMALFVPLAAQAELIDGTFDTDAAFDNTGQAFDVTLPDTHEKWLSGGSWIRNNVENFAEKTIAGEDIILQGFALPEDLCIGNGWKVKVSFDYKNPDDNPENPGNVKLYTFNATSGSWNSLDGTAAGFTGLPVDADLLDTLDENGQPVMEPYQTSFTLTGDASNYAFLAIGFDLPDPVTVTVDDGGTPTDVTYNSAVDNVVVTFVAPVNMKLTPRTLNLKSRGNWVNVAIALPRDLSCYTLADIDTSSLKLTYGGGEVAAHWSKIQRRKVMAKFSRQELATLLNGATGSAIVVGVCGTFTDGVAFEGETTLRVINPGGGSSNKPAKPAKGPKFLGWW